MSSIEINSKVYALDKLSLKNIGIDRNLSGCVSLITTIDCEINIDDCLIINHKQEHFSCYCHNLKTKLRGRSRLLTIFFSNLRTACKYQATWKAYSSQNIGDLIRNILNNSGLEICIERTRDFSCEWLQADETYWQTFLRLCAREDLHFCFQYNSSNKPKLIISSNVQNLLPTLRLAYPDQTDDIIIEHSLGPKKISINLHNSLTGCSKNYRANIVLDQGIGEIAYNDLAASNTSLADRQLTFIAAGIQAAQDILRINSKLNYIDKRVIYANDSWVMISKKISSQRFGSSYDSQYEYKLIKARCIGAINHTLKLGAIAPRTATIKRIVSYKRNSYEFFYDNPEETQTARAVNLWTQKSSDDIKCAGAAVYPPDTRVVIAFLYNDPCQPIIIGCIGRHLSANKMLIKANTNMRYEMNDNQTISCAQSTLTLTDDSITQTSSNINYNAEKLTNNASYKSITKCNKFFQSSDEVNIYSSGNIYMTGKIFTSKNDCSNTFADYIDIKTKQYKLVSQKINLQSQTITINSSAVSIKSDNIILSAKDNCNMGTDSIKIDSCGIKLNKAVLCASNINV
jgi:hypothetical protein